MRNSYSFQFSERIRGSWVANASAIQTFRTRTTEIGLVFFTLLVVVEIGAQRSAQMAGHDKKNFARIYRYWSTVIGATVPWPMGKIVFPSFPLFFPLFRKRKDRFNISTAQIKIFRYFFLHAFTCNFYHISFFYCIFDIEKIRRL